MHTSATPATGSALRVARHARQLSLGEVAPKAGLSVATLSRIETGKQSIQIHVLVNLAAILGVDAAQLLAGESGPAESSLILARALVQRSPAELTEIMLWAGKHTLRRNASRATVAAQFDQMLATIELMVEELHELRKHSKKR
ncbi:MAG TPA: helix-turn-helix transcriptional regulator [Thermoanaerobaculia bacterium]|nr:helix-turn-helix transcriptional regulator [Thermoanaerobaculia bacterium]